jgi:hypothetical protein
MESNGMPGLVHVSNNVYVDLQMKRDVKQYHWVCRGELQIKGKGIMTTFFVSRLEDGSHDEAEDAAAGIGDAAPVCKDSTPLPIPIHAGVEKLPLPGLEKEDLAAVDLTVGTAWEAPSPQPSQ